MEQISPSIWERFVPDAQLYDEYKYYIECPDGTFVFRADPYGFHSSTRPETASKVYMTWKALNGQTERIAGPDPAALH